MLEVDETTPSQEPSSIPYLNPSESPSSTSSEEPSGSPTFDLSRNPSKSPSSSPTADPTALPSEVPNKSPSLLPSAAPSTSPSFNLPNITIDTEGFYVFRSLSNPTKCLDIKSGRTEDDVRIQIFPCNYQDNQIWKFDDDFKVHSNMDLSKCLGIRKDNFLTVADCDSVDLTAFSQLRIGTENCSSDDGALLQVQAEDPKCATQNWDLIAVSRPSDVPSTSPSSLPSNVPSQSPSVSPSSIPTPIPEISIDSSKEYDIVVDYGSDNLCLDYAREGFSDESLITYECHGGDNQKWIIDSNRRIRSKINEKCIDFLPDHELYSKPVMKDCAKVESQIFIFELDGHIRNRDSLYVLGIYRCSPASSLDSRVEMQLENQKGTCAGQKWILR